MSERTIHEAWLGNELSLRSPSTWARDIAVAALAGVWIGALGPFGNFGAGPLDVRLTFHLALMATNVAALGVTVRLAIRVGYRFGISPWFSIPAAVIATCLPLSAVAARIGITLFPPLNYILSPFDWYFETLVLLLPVVCGYTGLLALLGRRRAAAAASVAHMIDGGTADYARPRLADRLHIAEHILALKVEDHYVRIYTASGSQLVLMRLSDAIAEMGGVEGLRTHRSWWVARRAVSHMRFDSRGGRLTLHGGLQAPVARSALMLIKSAGWHQV